MSVKEQHATAAQAEGLATEMSPQVFQENLREFPHFFQIKDVSELTLKRKRNLLDRLNLERNDDNRCRSPVENTPICNLIAFLWFLIRNTEEAVEETDKVLKSPNNDTNIVALANMAVMKWKMGDREEAEKLVNKLEELRGRKDFNAKVIDATAEMAYCYSRMGMKSSSLAVELFEEVVQARPREYSWKYSLALVLRRFTHINFRMYFQLSSEITSQMALRAFDLLVEIRDSDAPKVLKGRALAELGMLVEQGAFLPELKNATKGYKITQAKPHFEKAVKLAPRDVHVLTYSGKYFMKDNLEKSVELLERAIEIRATTTAHHYLGNTYVKMAKTHQNGKSRQFFRRGNAMGRGQRRGQITSGINRDETVFYFDSHTSPYGKYDSSGLKELASKTVSQACNLLGDQHQSGGRNSAPAVGKKYSSHHSHPGFQSWDYKMMIKSSIKPASIQMDHEPARSALKNYNDSITLSRGDNPPAVYDLGVFYVLVGDDDQALNQFTTLINQTEFLTNSLQIINAYEQYGLIYRRKKYRASSKKEEEKSAVESRKMLQAALQLQCQFVSSIHTCVPDLKATRPSFFELCSADKSKQSQEIRNEVARLFDMVKYYVDYLSVLKEMRGFRPQDTSDAVFLEKTLNDYVSREQYDDALLFLSLLETTKEEDKVPQWSDPKLPTRVRIMAARKYLMKLTDTPFESVDDKTIKRCFLQALQAQAQSDERILRPYMDDGWSQAWDGEWWHVMILHDIADDDMKVKGQAIKNILQNVCGLNVICMSDDAENDLSLDNDDERIIKRIRRSSILLLLCGKREFSGEFSERFLRILLEMLSVEGSRRMAFVVLRLENVQLPANLHPDRSLQCPPALFNPLDPYTPELIEAVIGLFCVLADLTIAI